MIIAFTAARLELASARILAGAHVCSGRRPHLVHSRCPIGRMTSGGRLPDSKPEEPDLDSASGGAVIAGGAFRGGSKEPGPGHAPRTVWVERSRFFPAFRPELGACGARYGDWGPVAGFGAR